MKNPEDREALHYRIQSLEKIMQIGREITAKQSLASLLKKILFTASEIVDCEVTSVILLDEHTEQLHIKFSMQPSGIVDVVELDIPVPVEGSIAGQIFTTKQPLIINNTSEDDRHFKGVDERTQYVTRNILGVPLQIDEQALGVLMAMNKRDPSGFTQSDSEWLTVLASQATVSIQNNKLYQKLQEHAETLEEKVARRTAELAEANEELHLLAITDPLTKINNRRHFFENAQKEVSRASRYKTELSILLFDIDHFKKINDTYGHLAGDQVLQFTGKQVKDMLRNIDLYARYGGEEFVILLPETDQTEALETADRLRQSFQDAPIPTDNDAVNITISLGVASLKHSKPATLEELLDQADTALYHSKEKGRNRVTHWQDIE
jgi:diguanylate cyclase (GGDEF)-like protein